MAVFSSIATAVTTATGLAWLGAVAAGALQVAAGIGVSLIAKAIAGEPEGPKFGVQARLQGGDDVPRSLPLGRFLTAGSLAYHNTWGTANGVTNAYHTRVIALTDMPIQSLDRIFVQELEATLLKGSPHATYGWPVSEYRKGGVDHMWVKFYDGMQVAADPWLVATVSSTERPYTSARVGYGVPYAVVTCMAPERKDGEERPLFSNVPSIKFELTGMRLYDPSRDSSVGGVGSQRLANPATWGGDGDHFPVVQAYNILLGITYGGKWFYGLQSVNVNRIPVAAVIAQINKCRAQFEGPDGMEAQYRTGGEIQVAAPIKSALEALLTACQGRLVETGGSYKFHVGAPGASVYAFTDADIISTDEQSFTPFFGLEDSINGVQSTYPNPNEGWKTKTAPPLRLPAQMLLDGNRELMASVSLDMVWSIGQVERLQKSALEEAVRARRNTLVLGPEAWVLEPGDIVSWTSPRNGYVNKLFRVDGMADRTDLNVLLDLTEVDPTAYDWDFDTDFRPVVDGPLVIVDTPPLPMHGWDAYGVEVRDNDAEARRPGIEVTYQSGLQNIESVRIQVRMPGESVPFIDMPPVPYGNPWRTQVPWEFLPNTEYEVRGIYVTYDNAPAEWSDWETVLTPNVLLQPGKDFVFDGVVGWDQLEEEITQWANWIALTPRELMEAIQNVDTHVADQEASNALTSASIRQELAVTDGANRAAWSNEVNLLVGADQALGDRLDTVEADVDDVASKVTMRRTAMASPGGGWARWGVEVRTTVGDTWSAGAMYIDTNGALSRAVFTVDQFIVTDPLGSLTENPFAIDSGAVRMNVANIGLVRAGRMESVDGKFVIDLNLKRISIST
jgi:hypothetical protein